MIIETRSIFPGRISFKSKPKTEQQVEIKAENQQFNPLSLNKSLKSLYDLIKDTPICRETKSSQEKLNPRKYLETCLTSPRLENQRFEEYLNTLGNKDAEEFLQNIAEKALRQKKTAHKGVHIISLKHLKAMIEGQPRTATAEPIAKLIGKAFLEDKDVIKSFMGDREAKMADIYLKNLSYSLEELDQEGKSYNLKKNVGGLYAFMLENKEAEPYLINLLKKADTQITKDMVLSEAWQQAKTFIPSDERVPSLEETALKMQEMSPQALYGRFMAEVKPQPISLQEATPLTAEMMIPDAKITFSPESLETADQKKTYEDFKDLKVVKRQDGKFKITTLKKILNAKNLEEAKVLLDKISKERIMSSNSSLENAASAEAESLSKFIASEKYGNEDYDFQRYWEYLLVDSLQTTINGTYKVADAFMMAFNDRNRDPECVGPMYPKHEKKFTTIRHLTASEGFSIPSIYENKRYGNSEEQKRQLDILKNKYDEAINALENKDDVSFEDHRDARFLEAEKAQLNRINPNEYLTVLDFINYDYKLAETFFSQVSKQIKLECLNKALKEE